MNRMSKTAKTKTLKSWQCYYIVWNQSTDEIKWAVKHSVHVIKPGVYTSFLRCEMQFVRVYDAG